MITNKNIMKNAVRKENVGGDCNKGTRFIWFRRAADQRVSTKTDPLSEFPFRLSTRIWKKNPCKKYK